MRPSDFIERHDLCSETKTWAMFIMFHTRPHYSQKLMSHPAIIKQQLLKMVFSTLH